MTQQFKTKQNDDGKICELYLPLMTNEQFAAYHHQKATERREKLAHFQPQIDALENAASRGKAVDIDLTAMIKQGDIDLRYENGLMIMNASSNTNSMLTPQNFTMPLKIEMRAKTEIDNIRIDYHKGCIIFDVFCNYGELDVGDFVSGERCQYDGDGRIPPDEFVNIECMIGNDILFVKVNGELRHAGNHYEYIQKIKENSLLPAPVRITPSWDSTLTVQSLRVTEM